MIHEKVRAIFVAAVALLAASVCSAQVTEHTLRLSHQVAADHPLGLGAQKFADLVGQKSGGKISVKVFPNGALGGEVPNMSALQGGIMDLSVITPGILASVVKEFVVFDLPFMAANGAEMDAVLDSAAVRQISEKLVPKGLLALGWWEIGQRHISNSKRPAATLDELKGLKVRTIQVPIFIDMFTALDTNPVPIPFPEVYTALEQKVVDGGELPLTTIEFSKFYEVQKYLTMTGHTYSVNALLIGTSAWNKLSKDEQKILQDAAIESQAFQRKQARELTARSLEVLKSKGMQVSELSPAELAKARQKVKPVVAKYTPQIGEQLLNEFIAEIERARKAK